jgi:hypothetical protein
MRVIMYLLSVLAQDEEAQRNGCVGIFMNMDPFLLPVEAVASFKVAHLLFNVGPIRYVGMHFCIDDTQQSVFSKLENILSSAQQSTRVRFRYHSGTPTRDLDFDFDSCFYLVCFHFNTDLPLVHCLLQVQYWKYVTI